MLKVVTGSFLFIWYVINSMVIQTVMLYFNLWSELKGVPVLMNIQKNVVLSTLFLMYAICYSIEKHLF